MNALDKFTLTFAPDWTLKRLRARAAAEIFASHKRHYEAAAVGRRTQNWNRAKGDVNSVTALAGAELRMHARDLIRNNSWAKRGQRTIANNTVGWGIVPKPDGENPEVNKQALTLWKKWANSKQCDAEGRRTFAGIQQLVMRSIVESGEVLVRRRVRRPEDKLAIPLQLQVLEIDFLDTSKDGLTSFAGGPIVQGVEFDLLGRRTAYWLFPTHPGSNTATGDSRRVPASEILHIFYTERPGQVRGVSWFGSAIVNLKELDEFDDAELVKQKIAACFAAFVTDDGQSGTVGELDAADDQVENLEPGMLNYLPPGKQITFGNPPSVTEGSFAQRNLRRVAAGLGVTYEDLTGDYSQVNFSSARMSRLAHQANLSDWQSNMLIPLLCDGVWQWAMEASFVDNTPADWTVPPLPMIEPDKEGLAYQRLVRNGTMTYSEMIRQQGGDPEAHWLEYAADQKRLDELKIQLDSDVRAVSAAGLTQVRVGAQSGGDSSSNSPGDPQPTRASEPVTTIEVDLSDLEGES